MDNKVFRCPSCGKSWSNKPLHGLGGYAVGTIPSTCKNCQENPPIDSEVTAQDLQIKDEEKHVKDIQDDILLSKIQTREGLIKFLFEREFEQQVYNEDGARREHLEKIMNKIMELWPEIDWKAGIIEVVEQEKRKRLNNPNP
jgi:hypothetical protein